MTKSTKPSPPKPPKLPKGPYEPTKLPAGPPTGPARIIQICEDLRTRNGDGYLPGVGGLLAKFQWPPGLPTPPKCHGTTCSPFTATVIGVAFDPEWPRDDLNGDPYVPMFNGGKDPLMPFYTFYGDHNTNDQAVNSIVKYNLGRELKDAEYRKVRRGDLVEIHWTNGGGHVVFCWDVHLDSKGEVDCIQIIGSNGPKGGVSVHGCTDKRWLAGDNAVVSKKVIEVEDKKKPGKKKKKTVITLEKAGNYTKVNGKIFVDDGDLILKFGHWYALPGVPKGSVDLKTFRVELANPIIYAGTQGTSFGEKTRFARFHYDGEPPPPYAMKDGTTSKAPTPPGHVTAPAVVLKGPDIKKNPEAPKKAPAKPVKQDKDKPLKWQYYVEIALRQFYQAKWIESDPGEPDNINDSKSQAALKELQEKFKIDVDGIIGPQTLGVIAKHLPACQLQYSTQVLLGSLFRGKKIQNDPGPPDGVNNPQTQAAVEELQKAHGLMATGVPDGDTLAKILEIYKSHAASPSQPGLEPTLRHLYWVGNTVEPGGSALLRLHCRDLIIGQECPVHLSDEVSGKEVEASVKIKVEKEDAEVSVPIPSDFGAGAMLHARVVADLSDEGTLEANTHAPLIVRLMGAVATETADWRPYIGKDEVPAEVLDIVKRNRAKYPAKKLVLVKGKYAGTDHFDYKPPGAHAQWAKSYFQKKVDAATGIDKMIPRAFVVLLDLEGRPASLQTYDSQIVTWGVGLGAKGDGVHAFTHLNKDSRMKKLLDDFGINYEKGDYQVVDLEAKKVVSSTEGKRGDDSRHIVPLKSWRKQTDLLSAIIGISEDPATREAVAESQYAVYLSNSASWPGRDKVFTLALFVMIIHMYHWMPAIAKYGFNVEKEFLAIGGGTPSLETDKKLALRIARAFVSRAKQVFLPKKESTYNDIHDRTKRKLWAEMRHEGKAEGFDPGELTYDD